MTKDPVIFIDDEQHIRIAGKQTLELAGYEVQCFESCERALPGISFEWAGVIVCDIKMPQMDGLSFMKHVLAIDRDLPVILITGHGDISMAVNAIRDGAYDFIEKPFPTELLVDVVKRAMEKRILTLENRGLHKELMLQNAPGPRIIGRTLPIQRLRQMVAQVADVDADVLVMGETGTGKELVAHYLHECSHRQGKNFVAVNCGALPENIIESELFGYEPGAFTGAQHRRVGKFEYADEGTLFLDEIESMPMSVQVKLLRVLQERSLERLGSNEVIPLNLRVVTATKIDLREACAQGTFREDLYYRLNVVTIEIPPLRDRQEDILLLFQHFVLVASTHYKRDAVPFTGDWISTLMGHSWPGNVRELRNVAERYVLLGEGHALEELLHGYESAVGITLPEQVQAFERSVIEHELDRHQGSITKTLAALGVPRKTLYDKMRKYGLDRLNYK
ncbi:MAG: sigma-54-dependent Fis family transcriptional regulator [SAR324 cluster bacterium]|nr:sigma-54-dependent Fis family transcriptional regulator [SAR324 cluster bacterium]